MCKIIVQFTDVNNATNLINADYILKYFDVLDNPIDGFISLEYKHELKGRYVKKTLMIS